MNSSRVSVFNEMIVRSTLTFTRSYLRFCSAEPEDSGDYVCNATSGPITDTSAVTLLGMYVCMHAHVYASMNECKYIRLSHSPAMVHVCRWDLGCPPLGVRN